MGADTLVGNPLLIFSVRVTREFFSGGLEFSFLTTIIRSFLFGSFTIAASITLEIRIEKHGSLRERFEILSRYIIDTVVQSLFTFTGRHFLMTAGDRSCPEDIIGL